MARKNRPKKNEQTGEWTHPDKKELFEEVGLYTLKEYIEKRRKTIGTYIMDRPILDLCRSGERQRGTSTCPWWWEQPFEADPEREEDASSVVSGDASAAAICSVSLSSRLVLFEYWCYDVSEHSSEILSAS